MRIAFIGQKGIPVSQGGVEKHVEELACNLAKRGHEILVYSRTTYKTGNRTLPANLKVLTFPSIPTKAWDTIIHTFLASIDVLFRKVDVIHYHSTGPAFFMFLPKIFKPSAKLIFTHHSPDWKHNHWGKLAKLSMKWGEWMGVKLADRVIAVSPILAGYIEDKYNKTVAVIPNGVSLPQTDAEKINHLPKKYILAVARLIRLKGLDHLIRAFNLISSDYPEYHLLIVGSPTESDNCEDYLKQLALKNNKIKFLGWQPSEVLPSLYERATVFAQPSEIEGLPITLLEASTYGLPLVVSDIPEHQMIVGDHAAVFKSQNHIDLAAKLRAVINNLPLYRKKGIELSQIVIKQFNWKLITTRVEEIYSYSYKKHPQYKIQFNEKKTTP